MREKSGWQTKNTTLKPAVSLSQSRILQRQCACGGVPGLTGQCEECNSKLLSGQERATNLSPIERDQVDQMSAVAPTQQLPGHSFGRMSVQAKLAIGMPGDKYEQEADRLASQVVQQIHNPAIAYSNQRQALQRQEEADEELQAKPSISHLQRSQLFPEEKLEDKREEEDIQAKSILQRREASTDLTSAINNARGSGQPLDAGLQRSMGQAMGADFSRVKVHTDAQSDQLNQSIQAKAFTTGQDVFFRQGAYQPGSRSGQELIAHELTHVVQQNEERRIASKERKTSATDEGSQKQERKSINQFPQTKGEDEPVIYASTEMIVKRCPTQGKCTEDSTQPDMRPTYHYTETTIQRDSCQGTEHDTSVEHLLIENDYIKIFPTGKREYEIPEGSLDTYDNGTHKTGFADLVDPPQLEIYDIKREGESAANTKKQLARYIEAASTECKLNLELGKRYPSEPRVIQMPNGAQDIRAYQVAEGVITYSKFPKGQTSISSYLKPVIEKVTVEYDDSNTMEFGYEVSVTFEKLEENVRVSHHLSRKGNIDKIDEHALKQEVQRGIEDYLAEKVIIKEWEFEDLSD